MMKKRVLTAAAIISFLLVLACIAKTGLRSGLWTLAHKADKVLTEASQPAQTSTASNAGSNGSASSGKPGSSTAASSSDPVSTQSATAASSLVVPSQSSSAASAASTTQSSASSSPSASGTNATVTPAATPAAGETPTAAPSAVSPPAPAAPTQPPDQAAVTAGTYYVSASGNNSNPGTAEAPLKTIQHAVDTVPAGSTIAVGSGTYNERLAISNKTNITVQNNSGAAPIISGSGLSSGTLITISNSSSIRFSGFEICNFKGSSLEGIVINDASKNIEISNCRIHDIGTTQSSGNAHVILAEGNSNTALTNIVIKNNEVYKCTTGRSESITIESNVDGFTVTGNRIHDVTNIAIDAAGFYSNGCTVPALNQARNGIISYNTVYNSKCSYDSCAGIYVDGGRNITIEKNSVYGGQYGIEVGCENPADQSNGSYKATVTGVIVRYNVLYNNTEYGLVIGGYNGTGTGKVISCQVYNNTLYKNASGIQLSYSDNISISRNIIYGSGGSSQLVTNEESNLSTNLKMDNNIYYVESSSGIFSWKSKDMEGLISWQSSTGQDLNSKFADPLFVNKAAYNVNLQSGSLAAGSGAK